MPPLIGITAGHRDVLSPGGDERSHVLYTAYTRMVREAGGLPVVLAPVPDDAVPALLDRLDGLVLTGGGDVEPSRYGGEDHPSVYGVDPERDAFELAVAVEAARRSMPTLAICRGMQVMNVAHGGTLVVDVPSQVPGAIDHRIVGDDVHRGVHEVSVTEGSTTAAALGATTLAANSIHHQGIGLLAAGFRATGTAGDGLIEAYEAIDGSWPFWAVQWHPEWLPDTPGSRGLFGALVAAASAYTTR